MKRMLLAATATLALTGAAAAFDGGRDTYPVDPLTSSSQDVQATPRVDPVRTGSISITSTDTRGFGENALAEAARKMIQHGHR
jgi:hypothetical protein